MADLLTYFVYFGVLIFSVGFSYSAYGNRGVIRHPSKRLLFGSLSLLVLVLVAGLRDEVGRDYEGYSYLYSAQPYLNSSSGVKLEFGYTWIVNLLNNANLDVWSFFTVFAFLTFSILFLSFSNFKHLLPLGIFFTITNGFLFFSFNGVRQAVAISVLALAIKYAYERKIVIYFILIFAGSTIHKSLLLFLPFYWILSKLNLLSPKTWNYLFVLSLILYLIPSNYFFSIVSYFSDLMKNSYLDYSNILDNAKDAIELNKFSPGYLIRVCIGLIIIIFYRKLQHYPLYLPYYSMAMLGVIIYNAFSYIPFIARLNNYFLFFQIFAFAFIIENSYKTNRRFFGDGIIFLFLLLLVYNIVIGDNGVTPYKFISF